MQANKLDVSAATLDSSTYVVTLVRWRWLRFWSEKTVNYVGAVTECPYRVNARVRNYQAPSAGWCHHSFRCSWMCVLMYSYCFAANLSSVAIRPFATIYLSV